MRAKLAALAALPRQERRILRTAWLSFLLVDAGFRFFSLPRVQRLLALGLDIVAGSNAETIEAVPPADLERLVDLAARHHLRPMACLQRSLVLQALLQRQGLQTDLRIGVQRHPTALMAHAWLEQAGQPLFDLPEIRSFFTLLLRPGEAR